MTTNVFGTIEDVRYTSGSFGEQYVTIEGTQYMTYWEIHQLKIGRQVEIQVTPPKQNCYIGSSQVVFSQPQAKFIRFI